MVWQEGMADLDGALAVRVSSSASLLGFIAFAAHIRRARQRTTRADCSRASSRDKTLFLTLHLIYTACTGTGTHPIPPHDTLCHEPIPGCARSRLPPSNLNHLCPVQCSLRQAAGDMEELRRWQGCPA